MTENVIDARGLKCPQPTLKITSMVLKAKQGDVFEVMADCRTFEKDLRDWCVRSKKVLLWIRDEGSFKRCRIQL